MSFTNSNSPVEFTKDDFKTTDDNIHRVRIEPERTGWARIYDLVRQFDKDRVIDVKEDIDTLLVFVSLLIPFRFSSSSITGRSVLSSHYCVHHRIIQKLAATTRGSDQPHSYATRDTDIPSYSQRELCQLYHPGFHDTILPKIQGSCRYKYPMDIESSHRTHHCFHRYSCQAVVS